MPHLPVYKHQGYQSVSQHYYRELVSRNPIMGTWIGDHNFDGLLPESGAEAVERNIAFIREMRTAFASLPENELSIDEKIDRDAMIQFANLHLFWEEDLQRWKLGRDLAMNIGEAIFLLFTRDFAPSADRLISIISRLKAVPPYLMSSKNLFQRVPLLYAEIYLESLSSLPHLLDTIESNIEGLVPAKLVSEYQRASAVAKKALTAFAEWLQRAIIPKVEADWAMGPGAFQAMLTVKRSGLQTKELEDMALRQINESAERLDNLSCMIMGIATGSAVGARAAVQKRIKSHAPANFNMTINSFRDAINRSRSFIATSNFATLPDNEEIEIIETPSFMTHMIPISAYLSPEKGSAQQKGIYLLTRSDDETAGAHNYASLINNAIHEVYPGHHLHLAAQNQHPGIMRAFCDHLEIIEGWARYCQNRVREMGFETTQESYFAHATADLFDSTRMYTDIQLQNKNWTIDQAVTWLADKNHLPHAVALAEIRRQIVVPGRQLCGIMGEYTLQQLQESLKRRFKGDYTDKVFHDLILYQGGIPAHLAQQYYPELMQNTIKSRNGF